MKVIATTGMFLKIFSLSGVTTTYTPMFRLLLVFMRSRKFGFWFKAIIELSKKSIRAEEIVLSTEVLLPKIE